MSNQPVYTLQCNLKKILDGRGLTAYAFGKRHDFKPPFTRPTILSYYSGKAQAYRGDVIAAYCADLGVSVSDMLTMVRVGKGVAEKGVMKKAGVPPVKG